MTTHDHAVPRKEAVDVGPCPWCGAPQRFAEGAPIEEARFYCGECFRNLRYLPSAGVQDEGSTMTGDEALELGEALLRLAEIRRQRGGSGTFE
jgi:hypothetical protein